MAGKFIVMTSLYLNEEKRLELNKQYSDQEKSEYDYRQGEFQKVMKGVNRKDLLAYLMKNWEHLMELKSKEKDLDIFCIHLGLEFYRSKIMGLTEHILLCARGKRKASPAEFNGKYVLPEVKREYDTIKFFEKQFSGNCFVEEKPKVRLAIQSDSFAPI